MKFLILDDNPDNRFLVSKTLLRRFPEAIMVECHSLAMAEEPLRTSALDLVIAHRTTEVGGAELVREVRKRVPDVPMIAISSFDQRAETQAAGANRFCLTDEWLLIGSAAAELLHSTRSSVSDKPFPA